MVSPWSVSNKQTCLSKLFVVKNKTNKQTEKRKKKRLTFVRTGAASHGAALVGVEVNLRGCRHEVAVALNHRRRGCSHEIAVALDGAVARRQTRFHVDGALWTAMWQFGGHEDGKQSGAEVLQT
jgi:hypothetical protein